MHIDAAVAVDARPAEVDAIFVDGGAALAHLLDQRHQRRAESEQAGELLADQYRLADLEERLGRGIGVGDHPVPPDGENNARQGFEDAGAIVLGNHSEARPERRRKSAPAFVRIGFGRHVVPSHSSTQTRAPVRRTNG